MSKQVTVCCDCGAVQDDATTKGFTVGRDPNNRGFPTTYHNCGDGGKHRTRQVTMKDDKRTKLPKATPKRTRPKPQFTPKKQGKFKSVTTEDEPMFKSPFSEKSHSYGRKIVDADGKIVCYVTKPKRDKLDSLSFILKALTAEAELTGVTPTEDVVKGPEVKLPARVTEAFETLKEHILEQENELQAGEKKLDTVRDALRNL